MDPSSTAVPAADTMAADSLDVPPEESWLVHTYQFFEAMVEWVIETVQDIFY